MTRKEAILNELERLPESLVDEVLSFIRGLKARVSGIRAETTVMSESSLKKNWLKPEEDEAWRDL